MSSSGSATPQGEPRGSFVQNLRAAKTGDLDALGVLLKGVERYLTILAAQELGQDLQPKLGASDLVQQTFLEAQKGIEGFQGETPQELFRWLQRILVNNLKQSAAQFRGTQMRNLQREVFLSVQEEESAIPPEWFMDTPAPPEKAIRNEELEKVERALDRLSADHQRVLFLRHQRSKSFVEIGEIMERSPDAVRKLWGRAILLLKKELEQS